MTNHILIVGPSWVGDMIMAQALFKLLKQQINPVSIDVLAPAWTFSVLSRMPEVNRAIEMPVKHGELALKKRYQIAQQLKQHHYDQAIVLPNSFKSALIPWLAGIKKRTGWIGECRYGLLNDHRSLDTKKYALMIEQYLALGLPKGAELPSPYPYPQFHVSKEAKEKSLAKYKLIVDRPVLALCPGAAFGPSKRWPEAYFGEVAKQKIASGWAVWLFGSAEDQPLAEVIQTMTNGACQNLVGQADLADTIDLLSAVTGAVVNDSGLMHMTAALAKPLIAVYGSTSTQFTPPLSQQAEVLKLNLPCQPCFKRVCPLGHHQCMRDITPDRVLNAMQSWGTA